MSVLSPDNALTRPRRQRDAAKTHSLSTLLPELLSTTDERSSRGVACAARPSVHCASPRAAASPTHAPFA